MGIMFTVYTESQNIDRAWPFDVIPRTIEATEWARIERGLIQRLTALNKFIDDLYHERNVMKDGVIPDDIIPTSANFLPASVGANPPYGVWANIRGSDLVRDAIGTVYVLEDDLRVPEVFEKDSNVPTLIEYYLNETAILPNVRDRPPVEGRPVSARVRVRSARDGLRACAFAAQCGAAQAARRLALQPRRRRPNAAPRRSAAAA